MRYLVVVLLGLLACTAGTSSSGSSGPSSECQKITSEVRDAAVKLGYDGDRDGVPDDKVICEDKDPTIQKDFQVACAERLRACQTQ